MIDKVLISVCEVKNVCMNMTEIIKQFACESILLWAWECEYGMRWSFPKQDIIYDYINTIAMYNTWFLRQYIVLCSNFSITIIFVSVN